MIFVTDLTINANEAQKLHFSCKATFPAIALGL